MNLNVKKAYSQKGNGLLCFTPYASRFTPSARHVETQPRTNDRGGWMRFVEGKNK